MAGINVDHFSFVNAAHVRGKCRRQDIDYDFLIGCRVHEYGKVIVLGNFAEGAAMQLGIKNYFKIPHPSGLNRLLNDKEYVRNMLLRCREYIHEC